MKPLGHEMILASAGSGKTYALTNRYIQLLARGTPPERIVALTFTRKAAGEFFDEILRKLARGAQEPREAARLAEDTDDPPLSCADCLRLLRAMTESMHRLNLGTLDSFFARLVRNFPLELGLAGELELLEESAARIERLRVLRRLFASAGELTEAQRGFIEAFKRATFGREEKRLAGELDRFLDNYQELHAAAPEAAAWGRAERIWPEGCVWLGAAARRTTALEELRAAWRGVSLTAGQERRWEDFIGAAAEWSPGAPLPSPVEYILKNAQKVWPELERGSARIRIDRRLLALGAEACAALVAVVRAVIGAELARRLEVTRGIQAVLDGYEKVYHELVRRAGRLTFGDVQRLLQPGAGAPLLTRDAEAGGVERDTTRLFIDYRLDARFDHWLLDEFQDTSFGQWSILRNLIDEVVQDASGGRTFFYVGDVKQAIFAWREGDPRLFREIFDHYNEGSPGTIAEKHLDCSHRSGPAVIDTVNRVFGALAVLQRLLPAPAAADWRRDWRSHLSAHPGRPGQVALVHAADEAERFAATLAILRALRPLEHGLSCAILVRTNDTGARLADWLRLEGGIPALAEADLQVATDNPLGGALLALFQVAAHPGDSLAGEHVNMTPLAQVLAAEGLTTPDALTRCVLGEIHQHGFEHAVETWLARLERSLAPDDGFSRQRGAQLAAAARQFDETGGREVTEFIRFVQHYTEREEAAGSAIRVMTVHKAKGLSFDVVLLPDLEGEKLDHRRDGLAVQRAADRSVDWVLDPPPQVFGEFDAVLRAHRRAAEAEAAFENLSLLYVAMTRARHAMYLLLQPPGTSKSANVPRLLSETLGKGTGPIEIAGQIFSGPYATGEPNWLAGLPPPAARPAGPGPLVLAAASPGRRRLPARRPSQPRMGEMPAAPLFLPTSGQAADFGAQVHALLASVEWWDPATAETWANTRRREGAAEPALREALGCLTEPRLPGVFARPAGNARVWREQAFEIVLDQTWVTGVFDRVVIEQPGDGPVRVTVTDFKTDRVADEAAMERARERHAEQLNLYRRVAAVLVGVPPRQVACQLVFTAWRRAVPVAAPP